MSADFRLCTACRFGDWARVKSILADEPRLVSVKDEGGFLPLHWAAYSDHREIAELLLTHGAEVDGRDDRQMTALHVAAAKSAEAVAALLIEYGANINAEDNNGDRPLRFATFANYSREGIFATLPAVFHLLSSKGATLGEKRSKSNK